ncbi:hypothetical protein GCM10011376_25380 [Nocardioides flavus (ex Wang et al. 2016)]|uniref:Cell wall-active antibiotics response 4TMS YvqF n=1 Tax=Nocardioides flavus (ex Wang et al. 2016) TaxID=2058780 RepID=A0ABQ3HLX8_9ACTN|nr:DUF1707 domain-containing protein [Nocardioides flavus (ex Wang et al. 2016)]GHE17928.1 hypothetical protein GCM10011376_25380 [Nocardioides flavus (ex Wang et al. 2016)]
MGEIDNRPPDPSQMRISDADRQRVADVLRDAAGEGRIDLDELEERLELTWQAKTYGDLVPITLDLHAAGPVPYPAAAPVRRPSSAVPAVGHNSSVAIMGDCKRRGVWQVPAHHSAFSLMGSVTLDLREAILTSHDTQINASAVMGDVKIIVPADMHVLVDGTPIMGDYGQAKDKVPAELGPDSPVVRVRGMALMGSVQVQRLPAPGTPRKYLGTY